MGAGAGKVKVKNTENKVKAVAAFKANIAADTTQEQTTTTTATAMPGVNKKADLSKFTNETKECFIDIRNELKYFVERDSIFGKDGKVKVCEELVEKSANLLGYNHILMQTEIEKTIEKEAMIYSGVIYKELGVLPNIVELMTALWDTGLPSDDEMYSFETHLTVFQTLTYYDPGISEELCEAGFLKGMARWLGDLQDKHLRQKANEKENEWVLACLANSNNCSSHGPLTKPFFDELNYVDVMAPYLKTPSNYYRTSCIICLAYIVDESRNDIFSSDLSHIKYVVDLLETTLYDDSMGWTPGTLSKGIAKLAVNDDNKKYLVDAGILPHLVKMAQLKNKDDVIAAVQLMWALSFHPSNKKKMTADKSVVSTLEKLSKSQNKKLSTEAEGCMWTLGLVELGTAADISSTAIKGLAVSKLKKSKGDKQDKKEKGSTQNGPHVMISYNWADQQMIIQIKQQLSQVGFRVWLDVEQMEGSTLQAMASGVERAVVILVCMSQKYKDSPNCRAEAEYAFQKQKVIIPLVMQRKYRADGWLGMIAGTKLFYDFSGKYSFDSRLDGLLKELTEKGKPACKDGAAIEIKSAVAPTTAAQPANKDKAPKCSTWTTSEAQKWIKGLSLTNDKALSGIDGEQLCYLQEMQERAPEYYFGYLERHLKLTLLKDIMKFDKSLLKLT